MSKLIHCYPHYPGLTKEHKIGTDLYNENGVYEELREITMSTPSQSLLMIGCFRMVEQKTLLTSSQMTEQALKELGEDAPYKKLEQRVKQLKQEQQKTLNDMHDDPREESFMERLRERTCCVQEVIWFDEAPTQKSYSVPAQRHYSNVVETAAHMGKVEDRGPVPESPVVDPVVAAAAMKRLMGLVGTKVVDDTPPPSGYLQGPTMVGRHEYLVGFQGTRTQHKWDRTYINFSSRSNLQKLYKEIEAQKNVKAVVLLCSEDVDELEFLPEFRSKKPDIDVYIMHEILSWTKYGVTVECDDDDWRKDTKTILELSSEQSIMYIEGLLPEKALTMITGPSFTGKTYQALEMALSLATGTDYLNHFKGPIKPLPVVYHVPELQEKIVRDYLRRLDGENRLKGHEEMLLIRPLELLTWQLDSKKMLESSRGRYNFLDTCGYFNDGDDSASYGQAIEFAKKINTLIREGCLGVCGVYHPPKYSKSKKETGNMMTLENQILGSAGYGGVLRSCIGMRNLHDDPAKGLWVYCQQLKVHGLQPYQVEGVPLQLIKKPGESQYLSELLKGGSKREEALELLRQEKSVREVCKTLGVSPNTVSKWKQEASEFDTDSEEQSQ